MFLLLFSCYELLASMNVLHGLFFPADISVSQVSPEAVLICPFKEQATVTLLSDCQDISSFYSAVLSTFFIFIIFREFLY